MSVQIKPQNLGYFSIFGTFRKNLPPLVFRGNSERFHVVLYFRRQETTEESNSMKYKETLV